jgi:hypothetical protein
MSDSMLLTFSSADDVYADYMSVLAWGVVIVAVTLIILAAANKGTQSEIPVSKSIKIGFFAYLLLVVTSYRETYGSFIEADVSANEAKLSFAGPVYHSTALKREQIKEVISGFPGKGTPHSCYIKFNTISGESYRSAPKNGTACKDQRAQIYALMKLPN